MRTYSALLLFETLFDSVNQGSSSFNTLVNNVFQPRFRVVAEDCGTRIGELIDVNYEIEGRVELATGLPISRSRIIELLGNGQYTVKTRTLSTCTAVDGVCAKCYAASRPTEPVPTVGSMITVLPLYDKGSEVVIANGSQTFEVSASNDTYDDLLLFIEGQVQDTHSYTVEGTTVTLSTEVAQGTPIVARYRSNTRAPFLFWMANTYSGHLLGAKPLPAPALPIRQYLLSETLPEGILQVVVDELSDSSSVPENMLEYLSNTVDSLEKALFAIALHTVFN